MGYISPVCRSIILFLLLASVRLSNLESQDRSKQLISSTFSGCLMTNKFPLDQFVSLAIEESVSSISSMSIHAPVLGPEPAVERSTCPGLVRGSSVWGVSASWPGNGAKAITLPYILEERLREDLKKYKRAFYSPPLTHWGWHPSDRYQFSLCPR